MSAPRPPAGVAAILEDRVAAWRALPAAEQAAVDADRFLPVADLADLLARAAAGEFVDDERQALGSLGGRRRSHPLPNTVAPREGMPR